MKKSILFLLILAVFIGCSNKSADTATNSIPQISSEMTQAQQDAYDLLLTTDVFASAAVGIAGSVSQQVEAFREILDADQAEQLFVSLQTDGQVAGQLYGVCGLYLTNKQKFDEVIPVYQHNQDSVTTFFGCIMSSTGVAELVPSVEDGSLPLSFQNSKTE